MAGRPRDRCAPTWPSTPWRIRYTERLAEAIIGLYKTQLIRRRGPWKGIDDVEYATLEWLDWFTHRRLLEPHGNMPRAEFEAAYWRKEDTSIIEELKEPSLR